MPPDNNIRGYFDDSQVRSSNLSGVKENQIILRKTLSYQNDVICLVDLLNILSSGVHGTGTLLIYNLLSGTSTPHFLDYSKLFQVIYPHYNIHLIIVTTVFEYLKCLRVDNIST